MGTPMVAHCQEPKRLRPLTQMELYDQLGDLVLLASKLRSVEAHNVEAFLCDKSDLVAAIGKLREAVRIGTRT